MRRLKCLLGFHRPIFAYVPTHSPTPPYYRAETCCMWCLKVLA